jgi:hypothetical protein
MSWKQAQEMAVRWVDSAQLRKDQVGGKVVDMTPFAASLPETQQLRAMVLSAAKRLLKARGAKGCVLPD